VSRRHAGETIVRRAFGLLTVLTVLACTSGGPASPQRAGSGTAPAAGAPAATARPALDRIRLAYATPTPAFAAPWVAKELGLFEKYGLDVDLTYTSNGLSLLAALLSGEVAFGEVAAPAPMSAYLEGGEVVYVASAVNRLGLMLVTPPSITRLEDLRGRVLGVTRIGSITHTFMRYVVRSAGLDPEQDVTMVQIGGQPETVAALESGRISAGLLGTPAYRVALASGMHVAYNLAERGVAWPQGGSVTTRSNISTNPERIRSYVKAYTEALQVLRTDRDASVNAIARYADLASREMAEQSWEDYRPYYAMPPYPDRAALEMVIAEELVPANPRASEVPPEAYYDDRFVRELDESGFIRNLTGR
jgi:NitT/TauT family transport system substrate-binding protein